MKVYSWPTLLVSVFVGGGALILCVRRLLAGGEPADFVWCIGLVVLTIRGLNAALSKEGYEEDRRRADRGKRVYRKLFGRFAPVMPYGALAPLVLAAACAWLAPEWKWLILLLLLGAAAYAIWLSVLVKKHMKLEVAREESEK